MAPGPRPSFTSDRFRFRSSGAEFVAAHPEWLRIGPDGKPDSKPNFANIRSGYAGWLLRQLGYVVRTYKVDGFWLDGYAPEHLHTYDHATRDAFRRDSGGKEIPSPGRLDVVHDPLVRQYLAWHEARFLELADQMRSRLRREPGSRPLRQSLGQPNVVRCRGLHG